MRKLTPLVLLIGALLAPATADAKATTRYYLALGDSLAAGYQQDAAGAAVFSANSYVNRVYRAARKHNAKLKLVNLGCPGESTTTFVSGGCPAPINARQRTSQQSQAIRFIKAHRARLAFITVSIGANEFTPCASGGSIDVTCAVNGLATLKKQLPPIARSIRRAAGKKVKIATNTLYNPYLALYLRGGDYADLAVTSATLAQSVNLAIRDATFPSSFLVGDAAALFKSTDLTTMVPFNGTNVPIAVANVCKYTQMCLPAPQGNIHPNDAGYALIAKAIEKVLRL